MFFGTLNVTSGECTRHKGLLPFDIFKVLNFVMASLLMLGVLSKATWADGETSGPLKTVSVQTAQGKFSWDVELASDDDSRAIGLMNRKSMPAFSGMLFRFDAVEPVSMWMKNTFIPLDMVFANSTGKITHIHYGAVPQSLAIIDSNGPVKFVLEVNAGEAAMVGLRIGAQLQHPWFAASR